MEVQEFTIVLKNVPGTMSEVTRQLAYWGVNIRAVFVSQAGVYSVIHLVVSDPVKAERVIKEADFIFSINPILVVAIPDEPGALAKISTILGDAHININYLYTLIGKGKMSVILIQVSDLAKSKEVLSQNQIEILDTNTLSKY